MSLQCLCKHCPNTCPSPTPSHSGYPRRPLLLNMFARLSVGWRAWVTRLECQRHEGRSQEAHWANHWLLVNTIVSFLITFAKKSWQSPKSGEMTIDLVLIISFISSPHQLHNQGFSMHGIWWSGWVAKQLASLVFVITQPPAVSSSSLFCSE